MKRLFHAIFFFCFAGLGFAVCEAIDGVEPNQYLISNGNGNGNGLSNQSVPYNGVHSLRMDFDKGVEVMSMPVNANQDRYVCRQFPLMPFTHAYCTIPEVKKKTNYWCFILRRPLLDMGKRNWRGSRACRASRASIPSYTSVVV